MKTLAVFALLCAVVQGHQYGGYGGHGRYYHDYYHYQGYLPGPPGYIAEVEGECGCCPQPCCCVCIESNVISPTTTTTPITSPTTPEPKCFGLLECCIALESSDSTEVDWQLLLQFVKDSVAEFPIGTDGVRFGMITYSTNATTHWGLDGPETMDAASLNAAIGALPLQGKFTNTPEALKKLNTECFNAPGDDPNIPNIAVVITYGLVSLGPSQLLPAAEDLQATALVIALGTTDNINDLRVIASGDGDENVVFFDDHLPILHNVIQNRVKVTCMEYEITTTPVQPTLPPTVEKECFCCCPPPPGYPDGHGHHAHFPGCKCP